MSLFDAPPANLGRTRSQSQSSQSLGGSPRSVAHSPAASTSALPPLVDRTSTSPIVQPSRVSSRRLSGDGTSFGPVTPSARRPRRGSVRTSRIPTGSASIVDLTNSSQADLLTSPNTIHFPTSSNKRVRHQPNGPLPGRPSQADRLAPTKADTNPDNDPSLSSLTCPICLGPPTPFALTSCGHAFCAPCLHSALVAGPALTPPPPDRNPPPGSIRNHLLGLAGRAGVAHHPPPIFIRGPRRGGPGVRAAGDEDEPSELDKRCPLCRTVLKGGWGRSLRGVTLRVLPKKVPALPPAELTDEDDDEGGGVEAVDSAKVEA